MLFPSWSICNLFEYLVERYWFGVYVHNAGHREVFSQRHNGPFGTLVSLQASVPSLRKEKTGRPGLQASHRIQADLHEENSKTKRGCVQAERGQELTCHYCTVWFKGSGSEFAVLIPVQYSVVSWEFWAKEAVRVMMVKFRCRYDSPPQNRRIWIQAIVQSFFGHHAVASMA